MLLYRIGKAKYSKDLTGEGAKLNGGRWNNEGIPCIYTAESRALALLEYTAHASIDTIPRALCFTTFEVPDSSILQIPIGKLPGNWNAWPHSKESRDFGSELLRKGEFLLLKFPSAIIPSEYNFIINPSTALLPKIKIVEVLDYAYDVRLKN